MDKDTNKADGIPVKKIFRNGKEWVDARSLYHELKIKWRYNAWIKRRLESFGFTCGIDYEIILVPSKHGVQKLYEYYLSPDTVDKILIHGQNIRTSYTFNTFSFNERQLQVTALDGKLWFVMRDIAHILNLSHGHTRNVYFDDNDRKNIFIPDDRVPVGFIRCTLISEFGLFLLFFRSKIPGAKEACKWLVNEAMPQIRKEFATVDTLPTAEPSLSLFQKFFQFIKSFTGGSK